MKRLFLVSLLVTLFGVFSAQAQDEPILYLYSWVEYVPHDVIEDFTKETGIRVVYDVYDSNDVLEAKLLTGTSRYDLVCPTAWPYAGPQIIAGAYIPLDHEKLPNLNGIDPFIKMKLQETDPGNKHLAPYAWGITGMGYNREQIKKVAPDAPLDSWQIIFDPQFAEKVGRCGISLLEEAVDVVPLALLYLGFDPNSENPDEVEKAVELLISIRPHISKFGAFQTAIDLGGGELCLTQGWSSEIFRAKNSAEEAENGIDIGFIIPKEGTSMWLDALAIPKGAMHIDNAHKFINFILRPEISARISNTIETATAVKAALPLIKKEIRENPAIFPTEEMKKKIFVDKIMPPEFARYRARKWFDIKSGSHSTTPKE